MVIRIEQGTRLNALRNMYFKYGAEDEFDKLLESTDSEDVAFMYLFKHYKQDISKREFRSYKIQRKSDHGLVR